MKIHRGGLLFLSTGLTALIWRYAWAGFITAAVLHRPFPLPEAVGTFGLAALITFISTGRGWRVITLLGIQVFGFLAAALRMVYVFQDGTFPFFNPGWLMAFAGSTRGPLEWFSLFLILVWAVIFWFGGVSLARKPLEYFTVCARFDLGLTFFFLLFLTEFLVFLKGGVRIEAPLSGPLLFPFFLFSLLAIALARNQGHARKEFLEGYRGVGVILSFIAVVLLFGSGIVALFLPYLTLAAEAGYGLLKTAAEPAAPVLMTILRFLFAPKRMRFDPPSPSAGEDMAAPGPSTDMGWWAGPFGEALRFLFLAAGGLILLVLMVLLLWFILRWLFSRSSMDTKRQGRHSDWDLLSLLIMAWRTFLRFCRVMAQGMAHRQNGAARHYGALLRWGRRSGMPGISSETPAEYGARLTNHFPALKREVDVIVDAFNREVYGILLLDKGQLAPARAAWRRLRSPAHWAARVKTWFRHPPGQGI
jgi:Domain of unknown function (DUF4129)